MFALSAQMQAQHSRLLAAILSFGWHTVALRLSCLCFGNALQVLRQLEKRAGIQQKFVGRAGKHSIESDDRCA